MAAAKARDQEIVDLVVKNIREICDEKDLVLSRVLEAADVNMGYLSNIRSSKSASPTLTKLQRIADALHVPLTALLLSRDKNVARNRLLRIADTLEPQQLELLEDFARAMSARKGPKK